MVRASRTPTAVRNARKANTAVAVTAPTAAVAAAGANPTKAEYDVLVAECNALRSVLLTAGLLK